MPDKHRDDWILEEYNRKYISFGNYLRLESLALKNKKKILSRILGIYKFIKNLLNHT